MNPKTVWQQFAALPPAAQQQVLDFMAFLQTRYRLRRSHKTMKRPKLANEAFIGMWRSREDLQDSSAWVRNVREREWEKRRE